MVAMRARREARVVRIRGGVESSGERGQSEKRESERPTDRLPDRLTRATGGRLLVSAPTPGAPLRGSSIVRDATGEREERTRATARLSFSG